MTSSPRSRVGVSAKASLLILLMVASCTPFLVGLSQGSQYQQSNASMVPPSLSLERTYKISAAACFTPVVADMEGDGKQEIVVGSATGFVYCLSSGGGIRWSFSTGCTNSYWAACADFRKDGGAEVVVVADNVYFLSGAGALWWEYPLAVVLAPPDIADVDGDGQSEILFGAADGRLYCLNWTGWLEWSYLTGAAVCAPPVVADINEDGNNEVLLCSTDSKTYCLSGTGQLNWNYTTGYTGQNPPGVADVDLDGRQEAIIGSMDGMIYCLTGAGVEKWNSTAFGWSAASGPAVADFNGDTRNEIMMGVGYSSATNYIFCWNATGAFMSSLTNDNYVAMSLEVADLDNDSLPDIVAGSRDTYVHCLDGGGEWVRSMLTDDLISTSPAVADVDRDNELEIIVGSLMGNIYCISANSQTVLPPPTTPLPWPFVGVYLIPGLALVIGITLFAVAVVARRQHREGGGTATIDSRRGFVSRQNNVGMQESRSTRPIVLLKECQHCGVRPKDPLASYCWNCGARIGLAENTAVINVKAKREIPSGNCMVCHLKLRPGDETTRCPYCGHIAHKMHLAEWLHVKDYCPVCHRHLDVNDLRSI